MIIVIVSDNNLLFESISLLVQNARLVLIRNDQEIASFLEEQKVINLLILDHISDSIRIEQISKFARNILEISCIFKSSNMSFLKPFRIKDLLSYIHDVSMQQELFYIINDRIIYDERASALRCDDAIIKLTEKENHLIKSLLNANNFTVSKHELLQNVWGYSSDTQTTTIETYVSRIKSKLPKELNIIGIDAGHVILHIQHSYS